MNNHVPLFRVSLYKDKHDVKELVIQLLERLRRQEGLKFKISKLVRTYLKVFKKW